MFNKHESTQDQAQRQDHKQDQTQLTTDAHSLSSKVVTACIVSSSTSSTVSHNLVTSATSLAGTATDDSIEQSGTPLNLLIKRHDCQLDAKAKECEPMDQQNHINTNGTDAPGHEALLAPKLEQNTSDNALSKTSGAEQVEIQARKEQLDMRELEIQARKAQFDKLEQELKERQVILEQRENDFVAMQQGLLDNVANIAMELTHSEQSFSAKVNAQKEAFDQGINQKAEAKTAAFTKDLDQTALKAFSKLEDDSKSLATSVRKALEEFADNLKKNLSNDSMQIMSEVIERKAVLDRLESELQRKTEETDNERKNLQRDQRRLEIKEDELNERESDFQNEIKKTVDAAMKLLESQNRSQAQQLEQALARCAELESKIEPYRDFELRYGATPDEIISNNEEAQQKITTLTEKLLDRPSQSIYSDLEIAEKEREAFKDKTESLTQQIIDLNNKYTDYESLRCRNQELEAQNKSVEALNSSLERQLERFQSQERKQSDREERVKEIMKGILPDDVRTTLPDDLDEMVWLKNILDKCAQAGFKFPRRILYAFHTALKISDWSCITVLAGVSGTGKSELPKLYANFGGLNFISVPVQPNWDSQESMLGYYNSIDNRFEPEDLLRFLVQCVESRGNGRELSMVLLDEMNLAHVEHYFADFLSKLESRRSYSKDALPTIEVKLGTGVEPYRLKLARNVLWAGTMNQDETTKSLSDKVLDRGIVINFPRPRKLISRNKVFLIDKQSSEERYCVNFKLWDSWIERNIELQGDQQKALDRYRTIVEQINDLLEYVGRAIGHRVWQSIEYYILNYPTVRKEREKLENGEMSTKLQQAMDIAFEDQIVQKIMPKLRGVETRGRAKDSLDSIESLLENEGFVNLKDDFLIACEQGYGQFMWSSAKYIEKDEASLSESLDTQDDSDLQAAADASAEQDTAANSQTEADTEDRTDATTNSQTEADTDTSSNQDDE